MKYKVGDKIKIKSIDWYNHQVKDKDGDIPISSVNYTYFTKEMSNYCGKEAKIVGVSDNYYTLDIDKGVFEWIDVMFGDTFDFEQLAIGEVFDYEGHKLKVKQECKICKDCYFDKQIGNEKNVGSCIYLLKNNKRPLCNKGTRNDGKSVIFKEIENMEKRKVELDIETAKKWYNGNDNSLRTIALQAYTEDELKPNELPNTWEEFCKNYHTCENDSCIDSFSNIITYSNNHERSSLVDKNLLPNKKYAEGILALCQLTQLRDCYRQGWVPDWSNCDEIKYSIVLQYTKITSIERWNVQSFLSFQTSEICDKFLNNFKDLIELAKEYI